MQILVNYMIPNFCTNSNNVPTASVNCARAIPSIFESYHSLAPIFNHFYSFSTFFTYFQLSLLAFNRFQFPWLFLLIYNYLYPISSETPHFILFFFFSFHFFFLVIFTLSLLHSTIFLIFHHPHSYLITFNYCNPCLFIFSHFQQSIIILTHFNHFHVIFTTRYHLYLTVNMYFWLQQHVFFNSFWFSLIFPKLFLITSIYSRTTMIACHNCNHNHPYPPQHVIYDSSKFFLSFLSFFLLLIFLL